MKSKFFVYALASMAFAACSNDNDVTGNDGALVNPTGEAYVSLSIKTPASTRALNDPNQENGTAAESNVKTLKVVFFNATNQVVDVKDWSVGTNGETGNPGQPTGTAGIAFEVNADAKKVLVVANPVGAFNPVGGDYTTVNAALIQAANLTDIGAVAEPNNFMMSNAAGELAPHNADLTLYSTKAAAEAAPLQINIDRVVAKVRVFANAPASSFATISDAEWVLNVTNKKFFPCSERKVTAVGTATPFDQYGLGSYRVDPNYYTQFDPITNAGSYGDEYNFFSSTSDLTTITWNASGASQYCLENTQDAPFNMHAYTTQVLFKATVSPTGLTDVAGSNYDIAPGADWIAINSQYYSYDELVNWIEKELTNKYKSSDPSLYTNPLFDQLYGYVRDVLAAAATVPAIDNTITSPLGATTTPTLTEKVNSYINALMTDKAGVEASTTRAKKVGNLSYYAGGVNYYKIMIKHDDATTVTNALGEFGVVRNSVYDVNIKAVKNPGYPVIPDPDPTIPDEDDKSYLSVQINVNPWTWYTQDEEL